VSVLYADTSAFAKLYIAEPGTGVMRERVTGAATIASSVLVWA
jgi:hypothetical protein